MINMKLCKICKKPIKKHRTYCSNGCKFSDSDYNKSRISDEKCNPKNKQIKHKLTGKVFKDVNNLSGVLTRYSNKIGETFSFDNWEVVDAQPKKRLKCPYCNWSTVDVENKSGWFTAHLKNKHNKTPDKVVEDFPHFEILWKTFFNKQQRLEELKEEYNRIECKECGKPFKRLTNTHLQKHGLTIKEYCDKYNETNLSSKSVLDKLRTNYYKNDTLLSNNYTSKAEVKLFDYLVSIGQNPIQHRRIDNVELDLFVPSKNIAIEHNGLYWHSEFHGKKDRNYHLNKTVYCESNNIHLIQIFEDEWRDKKHIVESRFNNLFGKSNKIYARHCTIKEVGFVEKNNFLLENHLQGVDNSSIRLGLYFNNELISLMTFGSLRVSLGNENKSDFYELMRFCNKVGYSVVGGASKLFKHFENTYLPKYVLSYADRRWTTLLKPTLYNRLGFSYLGVTKPNYWYMPRHDVRYHRYKFAKHKILAEFEKADKNLTEWQNMINLGYDRIWDCGSIKYEKTY